MRANAGHNPVHNSHGSFLRRPNAARDIAAATLSLADAPKDESDPLYKKHFLHFYWGKKPAHVR